MKFGFRRPQRPAAPSLHQMRRRRALRQRLRIWGGVVGAVALVAGIVWLLYYSPYLVSKHVHVEGVAILRADEVEKAADVPMDQPLARIDVGAIKRRVMTLAPVQSVEVSRSWPTTITITVTERTPVAVVARNGILQYVDRSGVLFGQLATRPPALPLIQADASIGTPAMAQAGQVGAALSADLLKQTDVLVVKTMDDIELQLRSGRTIVWGSAADSDTKARIAELLLPRAAHQVDVSVPSRPTTS